MPAGLLASVGHAALNPVQFSAGSQTPLEARQIVVLDTKVSAGHCVLVPVQFSVTSQTPVEGRQIVDELAGAYWQLCRTQLSTVQGLPSLQSVATLQLRQPGMGSCWHPESTLQESLVHALLSSQLGVVPGRHCPACPLLPQVSLPLHALPSEQDVPPAAKPFAGQLGSFPRQVSATSQAPAEARQTVPAATKLSAGHCALEPVQFSARSQTPAEARQVVVLGRKASAGHCALAPEHVSATSQTPAEARHVVPAGDSTSTGHCALAPEHVSDH